MDESQVLNPVSRCSEKNQQIFTPWSKVCVGFSGTSYQRKEFSMLHRHVSTTRALERLSHLFTLPGGHRKENSVPGVTVRTAHSTRRTFLEKYPITTK